MRVAVLPRLAMAANLFSLEAALSRAADAANIALAALRMPSFCSGIFWINVLRICESARDA